MKKLKSRPARRTVHRGVVLDHEPPIMPAKGEKPPPPGDRVLKNPKTGERWFIDGASGRATKLS